LSVTVYLRKKSEPKFKYPIKFVSGNIGIGVFSGKKKKVVWHYKKEPANIFTGDGFYFDVIARKYSHSANK
jgi:hypothetical protein